MKHQMQLSGFVVLATVAIVFAKHTYLDQKPSFITTCKRTDANLSGCFAKNLEKMFKVWKDGIPGLKSAGTLDPLNVKSITITQNNNNDLVQVNINMVNVKLIGLSDLDIKDITLIPEKAKGTIKIKAPKIKIESDYSVKGRILNLPLDSSGKAHLKIDDVDIDITFIFKLRDEFCHTFTDVDSLKLEISGVGGFHIDLENLFNGQKELEESTNIIINENWRDFYTIMIPAIKEAIQTIMYDRLKKVFGYFPMNYIIEDFPTAKEYSQQG